MNDGPARLLLPTAKLVEVVVLDNDFEVIRKSAPLANGTTEVTFLLDLAGLTPLTIRATATDSQGTLVFAGEADIVLTEDTKGSLSLFPVKPDGSLDWPVLDPEDQIAGGSVGTLALGAGQSTTFIVQLDPTARAFQLASRPATLKAYAQTFDGSSIAPPGGLVTRDTLDGESDFLLTYYATSNTSLTPLGRFLIPPVSITVTDMNLALGQSKAALPSLKPQNADSAGELTWTSDTPAVATVDAQGKVTGVTLGTAEITVESSSDSSVSTTFTVTVTATVVKPTGLTLEPSVLSLLVGGDAQITPVFEPSNATDTGLTWSSDAPDVADVDSTGTVTALTTGVATITAVSSADGTLSAQVEVQVVEEAGLVLNIGAKTTEINLDGGEAWVSDTDGGDGLHEIVVNIRDGDPTELRYH